jgi:hypothetical protein
MFGKRTDFGPHCLKRQLIISPSSGEGCPICDMCVQNETRLVEELKAKEHAAFEARQKRGSTVLMDFEGVFADRHKAQRSSTSSSQSISEEKAFSILAPSVSCTSPTDTSIKHLITTSAGRLHLSLNTMEQKLESEVLSNTSDYYTCKQFENFLVRCGFHWIPRDRIPTLYAVFDTNHSGDLHVSEILFVVRKAHALCRKILTRKITNYSYLARDLVACNSESSSEFLSHHLTRLLSS